MLAALGIQEALDRGALVVAPTALAAASLREAHDHRRRAAGHTVWQPANVLSWQQWLGSLWTGLVLKGHENRLLLNTAQEELLWRDILAPSLSPANLASAPAFAALARSAFGLAAAYNLTARLSAAANTDDTEQFARWAAEFTRICGRHGYLPAARLPSALLDHLTKQTLTPPAELHLTRFLDMPPADAELLSAVRAAGTHILEHQPPAAAPTTRLTLRAATEPDELRAVAHWLRDFLDRHLLAHPEAELPRIHIVSAAPRPDLAALDSILREVLAPELDLITADPSSAPWELAGGHPLAAQPVIATLLRLLRGLTRPLPMDDVTALLLSPFLGTHHDRDAAAQFDARGLRDRPPLRPELTFPELHRLARRSPFGQPAVPWLSPLLTLLREAGDLSTPRSHAAWTAFIREVAAAVAWPGSQPLTPAEFAASQTWDHLLDSIATLDFTGRRVPFTDALAPLDQQFQSATCAFPTQAPIRILSAMEAAVTQAGVLILLHATDSDWPPPARPHPLLPWHLQASAGMPGAHPARDAARAQRLTDALLDATPHVLVSFADEAKDAAQRLAPSLARLSAQPPWRTLHASDLIPDAGPFVSPELVVDDSPLPPLPSPQVSGGATVLQLQAACGFRAFAEIRLRSTEPGTPELGIDAGRAGSLLHQALDTFWRRVGSQATLLALEDAECDEHLQAAILDAFSQVPAFARTQDAQDSHDPQNPWDKAYRALHMQRLFHLLKDWLGHERSRAPFTVLGREQEQRLTVGPLELKLRVDRIDSVEDGAGAVLIDYKTGANARPTAWDSERPEEPQLPLYTLLPNAAELRGLAFARIRPGEFAWAGVQAAENLLGNASVRPDLEGLVRQWRDTLTHLAEQFAAGDHSVNPKSFPQTCTYCGQRLLCRLDPATLLAEADDNSIGPEIIDPEFMRPELEQEGIHG